MQPSSVAELVFNLLIVLAAGLVAGVAAKRLGISMLVGYLVVGTLLGAVGFGPMTEGQPGLEYLAQAGACSCCSRSASSSRWKSFAG